MGTVGRGEKPLQDTYMWFKSLINLICVGDRRWVREDVFGCSNFMWMSPFSELQGNMILR